MSRVPMTHEGAERLREELKQLKTVERRRLSESIARARELGDLKENAEYHAAREQQSFVEGRIAEIESKLSHAQIIDVTKLPAGDRVVFGSTVYLYNLENEAKSTYKIVGEDEADLKHHKISITSPIARAVVGKSVEDVVVVQTPEGPVEYEIENVEYV